jgi:hypothetical protein
MPGRSELIIAPFAPQANVSARFYAIGSCFASEMSDKLRLHGLDSQESPFGTVYHPQAIAEQLTALCTLDWQSRPLLREDHWFDFGAHSSLYAKTEAALEGHIKSALERASLALEQSEYLIITWGSAKGYFKDHKLCANCHKQPSATFESKLSTTAEIVNTYTSLLEKLKVRYPKLKVILSLSPVRHLRDGILSNSASKSILRTAIWELEQSTALTYFPAYEFLIDDLRDYRYTKSDLMHPSEEAVDYIWYKFSEALFTEEALKEMKQFNALYKSLQHRPQWPDSEAWRKHLLTTEQKLKGLRPELHLTLLTDILAKYKLEANLA